MIPMTDWLVTRDGSESRTAIAHALQSGVDE